MIKPTNYINIQAFMKTDLGLSGNELICYAIIFGFSQDGESEYVNGAQYVSEWLGCTYQTALSVIKKLIEKGLVVKREVTDESGRKMVYRVVDKSDGGVDENFTNPISENFTNPLVKNSLTPNSIYNNNIYNIINKINNKLNKPILIWLEYKKQKKQKYTPLGLEKCVERLNKLSGGDPEIAMEIVNESMANNYAGLFPLKNQKTKNQTVLEQNIAFLEKAYGGEQC